MDFIMYKVKQLGKPSIALCYKKLKNRLIGLIKYYI